jgi:hypothetical protein
VSVARAIAAAGAKDAPARDQRQQIIAAAENGTLKPEDYLSLAAIVSEFKSIGARLDRTATAAEMGGVHPVVVSAAAQQIRLNESKARLAGHGGFAPARNREGAGEVPVFSVTFNFSGKTERIDVVGGDRMPGPTIDMQPDRPSEFTTVVDLPDLEALPAG